MPRTSRTAFLISGIDASNRGHRRPRPLSHERTWQRSLIAKKCYWSEDLKLSPYQPLSEMEDNQESCKGFPPDIRHVLLFWLQRTKKRQPIVYATWYPMNNSLMRKILHQAFFIKRCKFSNSSAVHIPALLWSRRLVNVESQTSMVNP